MTCPSCRGLGMYPVERDDMTATRAEIAAWAKAHDRCSLPGRILTACNLFGLWKYGPVTHWKEVTAPCDGWHFIPCHCSDKPARSIL